MLSEITIRKIFSFVFKEDLIRIAAKIGIEIDEKIKKKADIIEVFTKHKFNINDTLNLLTKYYLIELCRYFDLPYSNLRKEDLILQLTQEILNFDKAQLKAVNFYPDSIKIFKDGLKYKVNSKDIMTIIENQNITFSDYVNNKEKELELKLEHIFRKYYEHTSTQTNIGGKLGFVIDLNIQDFVTKEEVGIEIKMWKSLKNYKEMQRLFGQIYIYTSERYKKGNLIVLVYGTEHEYKENLSTINYLKAFVEKLNTIFFFKIAI